MIDIIKQIIGISGTDYDVQIAFVCIAFCLYFMILFFNFISSIFNGVTK